jgi:hypothetical protein
MARPSRSPRRSTNNQGLSLLNIVEWSITGERLVAELTTVFAADGAR